MKKRDALYEEAEKVYREFFAEHTRLFQLGAGPSEKLKSLTSGAYREEVVESHASAVRDGLRSVGGQYKLIWVKRNPDEVKDGSAISLVTCIDASAVQTEQKGKIVGPEGVWQEKVFFKMDSGRLLPNSALHAEVESC